MHTHQVSLFRLPVDDHCFLERVSLVAAGNLFLWDAAFCTV